MPTTSFEYFLGRRSARAVRLLEENESVSAFVQGLLEHLIDFAEAEGIEFRHLHLDQPFVTHDGYVHARILKGAPR